MSEASFDLPKNYIDISSGQQLIGAAAVDFHIEAGAHPADVFEISELVNGDQPLPRFTDEGNKKYESWSREDFIANGKWLVQLVTKMDYRRIGRACRLGLHPNVKALKAPGRFRNVDDYKDALGIKKPFDNWDIIDAVLHVKDMLDQLGGKPSVKAVTRAASEAEDKPAPGTINEIVPIIEAMELCGMVMPHEMDVRQYQEWGYLFFLANNRVPTKTDLDKLSTKKLAPSHGAVNLALGNSTRLKALIIQMAKDRKAIKLREIRNGNHNGLILDLTDDNPDEDEFIRRMGRHKVTELLLPNVPRYIQMTLSRGGSTGAEFAEKIKQYDNRIEPLLVEAAARKVMYYPELFPSGDFLQGLKVPDKGTSFFADPANINVKELEKLLRRRVPTIEQLGPREQKIVELIMQGKPAPEIAKEVIYTKDDKRLRRQYLYPMRKSLRARNDPHLIRQAVAYHMIDFKRDDGPILTRKQKEILELISYGADQKTIGKIIGRAPISVSSQVRKAKKRLGVVNESQLVAQGFITGNLPFPHEGSNLPDLEELKTQE